MRLPFAEQAVVSDTKITGYLLNDEHSRGRTKAVFFRSLGFHRDRAQEFRAAVLALAATCDVTERPSRFGRKYAGVGLIRATDGRQVRILSVWLLLGGVPPPALVTAYPA